MRTLHTAEILLPMGGETPLRDAALVLDEDGTIVEVAHRAAIGSHYDSRHDHPLLLPGVLNCHVHLTDAGCDEPVPGGEGLNRWVRTLLAERNDRGSAGSRAVDVIDRMRASGTVAIGEVANNAATLGPIRESGIRCRFIHELIGFRSARVGEIMQHAEEVRGGIESPSSIAYGLGAHAPYSVSPVLMSLIAERSRATGLFFYQHLAEDPEERLLYEEGSGAWREFLEEIGAWDEQWRPPGLSPIEYYDRLGVLSERFVAVHLADARPEEIELLALRGVRAILSPASNLHITGMLPPLDAIVRTGLRFALGTDGRGSNRSIDVFDEARILLEHFPDLPAGILLEALTTAGAEILQFDDMGALTPGSRPGLISVAIRNVTDDLRALEREIIMEAPRHMVA